MKKKTGNVMATACSEIKHRLRLLCGRPSPLKRFISVLIIGGALTAGNICLVVGSIYRIGRKDAETEFLKLRHIETLKLQQDTIPIKNYELKIKN